MAHDAGQGSRDAGAGTAPALLITDHAYLTHVTGPHHPERPDRLRAIEALLRSTPYWERFPRRAPEPVDETYLAGVHTRAHVALVREIAASGGGALDADTPVTPASYDVARLAAGGARMAVDAVLRGEARVAAAFVRPPGHHAGPGYGMGFCLFNNVALAARHARETHGIDRVVILDWDVHHGNGTQDVFYREPGVVVCSIHQEHWYPGTGAMAEMGEGPGEGTTVNLPLPEGVGDGGYAHVWEEVVLPLVRAAAPGLILVSAGYDAHHADPLSDMRVTARGFGRLSRLLREAVERTPVVVVLEGGYDLGGLAHSVVATLEGLTGIPAGVAEPPAEIGEAPFAVAAARAREARSLLGAYWKL
ncbi:MAG TPA: histone deacetylase [bacterium]|nr:histone deacetylase [bacterium]